MKHRIRAQSRRNLIIAVLSLALAGGLACSHQVEKTSRISITAEALDRIDAAVERLAQGRWPSWSMELASDRLAFQVEVAEISAAEVCSGIGEVVRGVGDDIVWSADLTRDGRPLTRCGTLDVLARVERGSRNDPQS